MRIDFLAPEYGGTPKKRRHQIYKICLPGRGVELTLCLIDARLITIRLISNGANIELDIKVADVTACFVMKGIALGERTSEKDAYRSLYDS